MTCSEHLGTGKGGCFWIFGGACLVSWTGELHRYTSSSGCSGVRVGCKAKQSLPTLLLVQVFLICAKCLLVCLVDLYVLISA